MISAFGVEHGEVSKGLPRYLRDIAPVIGASPAKTFRGGEPLSRADHSYLRVRAHQYGKLAARKNAEWKKIPKTLENGNIARAEEARKPVVEAATKGKLARAGSKKAITDNTPIPGYKPRPKVPRQR